MLEILPFAISGITVLLIFHLSGGQPKKAIKLSVILFLIWLVVYAVKLAVIHLWFN